MAKNLCINLKKFTLAGSGNPTYPLSIFEKIFNLKDHKFAQFFKESLSKAELSKKHFFRSTIANTALSPLFQVPISHLIQTEDDNHSVGLLLKTIPGISSWEWDSSKLDHMTDLEGPDTVALTNILKTIKKFYSTPPKFITNRPVQSLGNILHHSIFTNNNFFSQVYKDDLAIQKSNTPAYNTRIKDNIPRPTFVQFLKAFNNLKDKHIPHRTKEFMLDVLNRTTATPKLQHTLGHITSPICQRCNVTADSFHIYAECIIPYMSKKAISMFLNLNGLPSLSAYSLPYFLKPDQAKDPSQWIHLFGELSRLALNIHNEPRFRLFSPLVFYHKILVTITDCLQIRKYGIGNHEQLELFRDFFISHLDVYHRLWFPSNNEHLR